MTHSIEQVNKRLVLVVRQVMPMAAPPAAAPWPRGEGEGRH
jgi:hypothetical protein